VTHGRGQLHGCTGESIAHAAAFGWWCEHLGLGTTDIYGYTLARMRFDIVLAPEAARQLRALRSHIRAEVWDAIELHLRHEPEKPSRSRIKRLRGLTRPQYRLRVGEVRVFYDVEEDRVEVLAIIDEAQATAWLEDEGEEADEGAGG
jgi:mRNA-degrading endonuclease RelE of RelBE toxin-antitoxin system